MKQSDASTFSTASAWIPEEGGVYEGCLPETWTQGRAIYGGLLMAGSVRALQTQVPRDRQLRSLLSTFVAPVRPGEFRCDARILRSGSSFTHGEARIVQGDSVCVVIAAGFGTQRPPGLVVPAAAAPAVPPPDDYVRLPMKEEISRSFSILMWNGSRVHSVFWYHTRYGWRDVTRQNRGAHYVDRHDGCTTTTGMGDADWTRER